RDLLGPTPEKEVARIEDFRRHVFFAAAAPDASYFVACGMGAGRKNRRIVQAYDGSGKPLWPHVREYPPAQYACLATDPDGKRLFLQPVLEGISAELLEMPSGRTVEALPYHTGAIGPSRAREVYTLSPTNQGYVLRPISSELPAITLGIDTRPSALPVFSRD